MKSRKIVSCLATSDRHHISILTIMDITRLNFIDSLPEISEIIRNCDFIAVDTELSGLMRDRNLNRFDLPEERFAKAAESSRGYFIMQFGLSCFTRRESDVHYDNRTYNFYIFPQDDCELGNVNRTFSLQSHAIKFLTEHGFDFNKLFKDGLSYLTFPEKYALEKQLKFDARTRTKVDLGPNGLPKFVPNGMADNCREWLKKAKKFVDQRKKMAQREISHDGSSIGALSELKEGGTTDAPSSHELRGGDCEMSGVVDEDLNKLELKDCSTSHKRSIFKRVLECQPFLENIEIGSGQDSDNGETYLIVHYIDKSAKEEKQRIEMISAKGFLEVLELVILNKKPVVGHNLALDLIQIINQFIEPLSDDYNSFKEICHSLIPLIYDTKYIAHSILDPDTLTNNQSRLNDLYCQLRDSETFPKIVVNHLIETLGANQMAHQAGYDAYMSGYCFIALCEAYIREKNKKRKIKKELPESTPKSIAHNDLIIESFSNKIHLSYSYDFKYFNLGGNDEEPNRDHVFYIEHPQNWTLDDIFQAFHQYGGVTVGKLSKTSALCALRDTKHLQTVMSKAGKPKDSSSNHKIYSYDNYLENFKPKRNKDTSGDCDLEF